MKIVLASGSPRRKQLLEQAGIAHEVIVSNVIENAGGPPDEMVKELALMKARAVLPKISGETIIIAADTVVHFNDRILGKPQNPDEAFAMLKTLQGRRHTVYTGVAMLKNSGGSEPPYEHVFADAAWVYFRSLSDDEIHAYVATGEPFDKAGAYGVQERGAVLVERIEGDFYTVMGLPLSKVCRALAVMGHDIWDDAI